MRARVAGAALASLLAGFAWAPSAQARLELPSVFGDFAVLQRDQPIQVWGTADPGASVSINFAGEAVEVTAQADGSWLATLPESDTGGPYELTVSSGTETKTFSDILVGEVWICSGQSNMQWPLRNTTDGEAAMAAAANPNLRILRLAASPSADPSERFSSSGWGVAGPENLQSFSGVGYYFGKYLQEALDVPVGIITAAVGGTRIEAWMSAAAISNAEKTLGLKVNPEGDAGGHPDPAMNRTSALFNGAIHPLRQFPARGWVWYQGEANAGKAWAYRTLLSELIVDWRKACGGEQMPFIVVQLPGFAGREDKPYPRPIWAELRESQMAAVEASDEALLIVTSDLGERHDIHPPDKKPLGDRIGGVALAKVYHSGEGTLEFPKIEGAVFSDGKAILTVDAGEAGLLVDGPSLEGFVVREKSGEWLPANATLEGNKIILTSAQVPNPDAARYNWENFPEGNLISSDGLPTIPYRSDDDRLDSKDRI